jgi:hypothetical protein
VVVDFRTNSTHFYQPNKNATLCFGNGLKNDPYHECYVCKPSDL